MQAQGDEGEGKWEVSQGNKELPRMLLSGHCIASGERHSAQLVCTLRLHLGFSPQDFQGETGPQSNPWKGEMGIKFLCSSLPSSIP